MDYALALKLKNAGFPQKGYLMIGRDGKILAHTYDHCACPRCYDYEEGYCTIPTLTELIEACGDKFHGITKYKPEEWTAEAIIENKANESGEDILMIDAPTPEEAVANLWLELNKK